MKSSSYLKICGKEFRGWKAEAVAGLLAGLVLGVAFFAGYVSGSAS